MIANSRLEGLSISQLEGNDLRAASDQIIFQTAALFGCPLPLTDTFAELLSSCLMDFLCKFGFGNLTESEIILALNFNCKGGMKYASGDDMPQIEFSGACFNVRFVSKILNCYLFLRNTLDRKLINHYEGYE